MVHSVVDVLQSCCPCPVLVGEHRVSIFWGKKVLGLSSALIASIKAGLSASHKVHCINRQTGVFSI